MASIPGSTFDRALERFRDSLTEEQKRQFLATNLKDVTSEIETIQRRFGSEKKLRNLRRVSKFLEAMKQVEQVVNVFLNVHESVAFVWVSARALHSHGSRSLKVQIGAYKTCSYGKNTQILIRELNINTRHKIAGTRVDSLERLLDAYVEIGEVIPGLQQYDQLFKNFPVVREVLQRYFEDILQFHRKALDVFARPGLSTLTYLLTDTN
jgi:hypothetical protein